MRRALRQASWLRSVASRQLESRGTQRHTLDDDSTTHDTTNPAATTMPDQLPALPFTFHVDPNSDGLAVAEFTGREALSQPYSFDIVAWWPGRVSVEDLPSLGTTATLACVDSEDADATPRVIHGVLSRVTHAGTTQSRDNSWVRFRLVPRLSLLKKTSRRAVFQDMSIVDVVTAVLAPYAVASEWRVTGTPPTMAYVVQYDESDFDFIQRLLARWGLFYYFEQEPGQAGVEKMIICGTAQQYAAVSRDGSTTPIAIKLADHDDTYHFFDSILSFAFERIATPTAKRQRDWDMRAPKFWSDVGTSSDADAALDAQLLAADEFQQRNANDPIRFSSTTAAIALEQERARTKRARGTGDCVLFSAGYRFALENHPTWSSLNGAWVLTKVEHTGKVPGVYSRDRRSKDGTTPAVYRNKFSCAPADTAVRPPRPAPRVQQATESAFVVGPDGEEVYVDAFGRIKIQFLWDRSGGWNERSSCWIRTMQPWTGSNYGFQFTPRIGTEVLGVVRGRRRGTPSRARVHEQRNVDAPLRAPRLEDPKRNSNSNVAGRRGRKRAELRGHRRPRSAPTPRAA